jgi:valyl-tRNA synthetase
MLQEQAATLAALAYLDASHLTILESIPSKPEGSIALVVGPVEIYLPLAGMVDSAEEKTRLEKDLRETQAQIERLSNLLAGSFAEKAPPAVVQKEREKLAAYQETAKKLQSQLESFV